MFSQRQEPSWFAVTVRPNHERTAERALKGQGLETYLPVQRAGRRWSDRIKSIESALFPGYLFCRFGYADRLRVLNSPGVRSIVSFGKDPLPVDEDELLAVRALIASGRPIVPCSYIRIGQKVAIRGGPMDSLRGAIVRVKDSWRVVVSVEALSCSIAIEVDAELVAPDDARPRLSALGGQFA